MVIKTERSVEITKSPEFGQTINNDVILKTITEHISYLNHNPSLDGLSKIYKDLESWYLISIKNTYTSKRIWLIEPLIMDKVITKPSLIFKIIHCVKTKGKWLHHTETTRIMSSNLCPEIPINMIISSKIKERFHNNEIRTVMLTLRYIKHMIERTTDSHMVSSGIAYKIETIRNMNSLRSWIGREDAPHANKMIDSLKIKTLGDIVKEARVKYT